MCGRHGSSASRRGEPVAVAIRWPALTVNSSWAAAFACCVLTAWTCDDIGGTAPKEQF